MKNLSISIMTKFNSTVQGAHNSFYTIVPGKLYKERAPQGAVLPYAVYHIISDVHDWNFTDHFERVRIQFDLYSSSNSSSEIEDMYTYLDALFNWSTFTITSNTLLHMHRESGRLTRDPTDDVWAYNIDYEVFMESTVHPSASVSPSISPSNSPSVSPSASPSGGI